MTSNQDREDGERSRFGQDLQFNFVHAKCERPVRHLRKELGINLEAVLGFKPGENKI